MTAVVFLLVCIVSVVAAASSVSCDFAEEQGCTGDDMVKVNGTVMAMTQQRCCQLCHQTKGCAVAVLVSNRIKGLNLCELKSACSKPRGRLAHHVKCCLPGATRAAGCAASAPTPAWQCRQDLLPTFCDHTKSIDERVDELVGKMTDQEKIDQVGSNGAPSIDRLGIPSYQWWGEAQHGVCNSPSVHFRPPTSVGTSFPEPGLTAATFDKELFTVVGDVIGLEGRAMANAGNAGLTFWAPNINIVRDPRWGRLLETPGEDPYLTSEYAIRFIRAMQGIDPAGRGYLRVASTPKHYAGYNLDNWHGMDRYHYNAVIDKRDWADTYSQPFQAAIVGANASGLMCSYNAMTLDGYPSTGVPACADPKILNGLARETFGFDGYITGDCDAAKDVWSSHHFGGDAAGAVAASLTAGMDVDCGSFVKENGMEALKSGSLARSALDRAVKNLFRLRTRLGYFDPPDTTPWGNASHLDLNYTAHFEKALSAAREGITLLVHKREVLPLTAKTLAVSGPNADNAKNMQGIDCHGVAPFLITPVQGLGNYSQVTFTPGCSIGKNNDTSGFAAAAAAAKAAEATVLVLGLDPSIEYEMRDRTDLLLPGSQAELVLAVREAMGPTKPLVVVLMGGGVVDTAPVDHVVDALLWVGYPGQAGGQALAEVLYGVVPPSGRSPLTWYPNDYASDASPTAVSMLDMGMRPAGTSKQAGPCAAHGRSPGRTYRFYQGPVRHAFGAGLTYGAEFVYSMESAWTQVSAAAISGVVTGAGSVRGRYKAPGMLNVSLHVRNAGQGKPTDHSVLLFAQPPNPGRDGAPLKSLVAFDRVRALPAGGRATVTFELSAWSLALADAEGEWGPVRGAWTLAATNGSAGGSSASVQIMVE